MALISNSWLVLSSFLFLSSYLTAVKMELGKKFSLGEKSPRQRTSVQVTLRAGTALCRKFLSHPSLVPLYCYFLVFCHLSTPPCPVLSLPHIFTPAYFTFLVAMLNYLCSVSLPHFSLFLHHYPEINLFPFPYPSPPTHIHFPSHWIFCACYLKSKRSAFHWFPCVGCSYFLEQLLNTASIMLG